MSKGLPFAVSLLAASLMTMPAQAAGCARYGTTVTLTGQYAYAVVSEARGAWPGSLELPGRTADLLILDEDLCVFGDAVSGAVLAAADVQVLCPDLVVQEDGAASVTGRLVGAHTGNGHTPVLLVCDP